MVPRRADGTIGRTTATTTQAVAATGGGGFLVMLPTTSADQQQQNAWLSAIQQQQQQQRAFSPVNGKGSRGFYILTSVASVLMCYTIDNSAA